MLYPTQIPYINPISLVSQIIGPGLESCGNPIFAMLTFGKIPENPVITPKSTMQLVTPSATNRYLQTVTVKSIPTTTTKPAA